MAPRRATACATHKLIGLVLLVACVVVPGCVADEGSRGEDANGEALTEYIETLLGDEDAGERRWAAAALGQMRDSGAVPALIEALRNDEDRHVQSQAVIALGMIGDPAATEHLIAVLEDEDEEMRAQSVQALGAIGDLRAVPPVAAVLGGDRSPYVRHSATQALARFGTQDAVESLAGALTTDASSYVREGAVVALAHIGTPETIGPLIRAFEDRDARVRWEASKGLGDMGEVVVEPLIHVLTDGQGEAPWFAAFALERTGLVPASEGVDGFLSRQGIDLMQVSANYRSERHYGVMVLALQRHGSWDMADYYRELDLGDFDIAEHMVVVVEAAHDWLRENR